MTEAMKWRCESCNGISLGRELLTAPSPFDPDETLTGCPLCKSAEGFENICDEPGCKKHAGCGFPTSQGYRRTCYDHSDFKKEAAAIRARSEAPT